MWTCPPLFPPHGSILWQVQESSISYSIITRRKRAKPACKGEEDRSPPRFGILSLCLSFFLLKNKHIESKSFMQNRKSKDLADGSQAGCTVRAERQRQTEPMAEENSVQPSAQLPASVLKIQPGTLLSPAPGTGSHQMQHHPSLQNEIILPKRSLTLLSVEEA